MHIKLPDCHLIICFHLLLLKFINQLLVRLNGLLFLITSQFFLILIILLSLKNLHSKNISSRILIFNIRLIILLIAPSI